MVEMEMAVGKAFQQKQRLPVTVPTQLGSTVMAASAELAAPLDSVWKDGR